MDEALAEVGTMLVDDVKSLRPDAATRFNELEDGSMLVEVATEGRRANMFVDDVGIELVTVDRDASTSLAQYTFASHRDAAAAAVSFVYGEEA